jgi:hypothetical protein
VKIVLEGTDEFGSAYRSELTIDKDLALSAGEIGFSVEDGKAIMAHLQQVVVNHQCLKSADHELPALACLIFAPP